MKKIFLTLITLCISVYIFPNIVSAQQVEVVEDNFIMVSQTEKYYKTTTYKNKISIIQSHNFETSNTIEITKEEYENVNIDLIPQTAGVETTYKKLTSTIYSGSNVYKYQANLTWKNMPSTRSYDIIGIGYYSDVKPISAPTYFTDYCTTSGICRKVSTYSPQTFSNGVGASFELPSDKLSSLSTTLSVTVTKNTSSTITNQIAAADYAHATSAISANNAKKYSVNTSGIVLNGIDSYYDTMQTATDKWTGNW